MTTPSRIGPIERATQRSWPDWLEFLASIDAERLNHTEIAARVFEELDGKIESAGWWAQGVTIAYEQAIGRRLPGQRADGTFETSVSRATSLGLRDLTNAWAEFARSDEAVLAAISGEPRVGGTEKRMTWRTRRVNGAGITVRFEPKKDSTASLIVELPGQSSPEANETAKATWTEILSRFLEGLQV